MKKILITGPNGYITKSLCAYMKQWPKEYLVTGLSVRGDAWRGQDFSEYDCIIHAAGIAHRKETKENRHLYYEINRDLTIELAVKARKEGVGQFVFLSSISVYGMNTGRITKDTIPSPKTNYGKSKLQAEQKLLEMADENFKVCILRPPMVYGKDCKGNFQRLVKLVKMMPVFPKLNNQRSMIYIDNLCELIRLCIDRKTDGVFLPQNKEYVKTDEIAMLLAKQIGTKIYLSYLFGGFIWMLKPFIKMVKKAFGSLVYSETEVLDFAYCIVDFEESIKCSVQKQRKLL